MAEDKPEEQIVTGEEAERLIWKNRCKVYRFSDGEWKQRGAGEVTYMQHKDSGKIRIVMRQDKTFKVVVNHYVNPSDANTLDQNFGNDRSRVWSSVDFSDGGEDNMTFAIKFGKSEEAAGFEELFNKAKTVNGSESPEQLPDYVDPFADEPPAKVDVALDKKSDDAEGSSPAAAEAAAASPSGKDLWKQILEEKKYEPLSEEDMKKLWHKYDKDKSDSIDHKELRSLYLDLMDALFDKLEVPLDDSSRDGVKSEVDAYVTETVEKLDKDHDNKLSWEEFKHITEVKLL